MTTSACSDTTECASNMTEYFFAVWLAKPRVFYHGRNILLVPDLVLEPGSEVPNLDWILCYMSSEDISLLRGSSSWIVFTSPEDVPVQPLFDYEGFRTCLQAYLPRAIRSTPEVRPTAFAYFSSDTSFDPEMVSGGNLPWSHP